MSCHLFARLGQWPMIMKFRWLLSTVGNLRQKALPLRHSARLQHVQFEGEVIQANLIPRGFFSTLRLLVTPRQ